MRLAIFLFYVIHRPCAEFQFPTMPATGLKVCGGVVWWWLKPILVFSLAQAEQKVNSVILFYTTHNALKCWIFI